MLLQKHAISECQEHGTAEPNSTMETERLIPDDIRSTMLGLRSSPLGIGYDRLSERSAKDLSTSDFIANAKSTAMTSDQKAFGLLEDVKNFIPHILRENDILRQSIFKVQAQADEHILTAQHQTREWMERIEASKEQIATLGAMVLDLRSKLQRAESVVAIGKELSSKAVQEAAEAECLAKLFEDTVISSFGIGTMFQDALSRLKLEKE